MSDGNVFGKNVIIFHVEMISLVHINNNERDILILGKGSTNGLDNNTTLTAEKGYSINFGDHQKNFFLSLHYNGVNRYVFFNGVEIHKFKTKNILKYIPLHYVWVMFQKIFQLIIIVLMLKITQIFINI